MTGGGTLQVDRLTVRFGATLAVDDVSLRATQGHITGLIGPNGAGKTTTFNACSGLLRPTSGTVQLLGTDVTRTGPAVRARLGLGRSFQRLELCESLTVAENVAIARQARKAGANPLRQVLGCSWRDTEDAVADALGACGLDGHSQDVVSTLSTGQRRLVELARVVAAGFTIALLDEPTSGLDTTETHAFGTVLQRLVHDRGIGILLVEHDMALVMAVCREIYVLDFGRLLFAGTPEEVRASDTVRAAYLGDQMEEEPTTPRRNNAASPTKERNR